MFKFILILLLIHLSWAYKLVQINPDKVIIDFGDKKDLHFTSLKLSNNLSEVSYEYLVFIGELIEKYDRPLPDNSEIYCQNNPYQIVKDWSRQERYPYSCCVKKQQTINTTYIYCPIPSTPEMDFIRDLLFDNVYSIYIKAYNTTFSGSWQKQYQRFYYLDENFYFKFLKSFFLWGVFLSVILGVTYHIMGLLNRFANKYAKAFTIAHINFSIFLCFMELFVYRNINEEYTFHRNIMWYSFLNTSFSLFFIYTPFRKITDKQHEIDQRIKISGHFLNQIVKIIKKPLVKQFCSILFCVSYFYQLLSIYTFTDFFKEYLEFDEIEILAFIGITKFIHSMIFFVAYITAIYEVYIPIKLDKDTGQLIQIFPESMIQKMLLSSKVSPSCRNHKMVGLYNGEYFARFSTQNISEDELIAIQKTANDNLYSMYAWKIGHVTGAGYEFYIENPEKKWYFLNVGHGPFTLEKGMFKERYSVYQYTNGMFVSSGRIQQGYFYQHHHLLIQIISSVLKILPEYVEEDYEVNLSEILRCTMHFWTRKIGNGYGWCYWSGFTVLTIFSLLYTALIESYHNFSFQIFQIWTLISFFIFLLNVDIEIVEEETTEQQTENTRLLRGEEQNTTVVELISQSDLEEFLGRNVYEVEKILKAKNYKVEVVHEMTTVFPDYNECRIRLFHDDNDVIVVIPEIG